MSTNDEISSVNRCLKTALYFELNKTYIPTDILPKSDFQEWKSKFGWFNTTIQTSTQWSLISEKCKCVNTLGMGDCLLFPKNSSGTYGHFFHRGFD